MFELVYSPLALRYLEKSDRNVRERILKALERLRIRPESCDIKKIVGTLGYRFRVGNYRVIFDINKTNQVITITKIGHRKKIYKKPF